MSTPKKILIISYYFPPNTAIPSWRPNSWADYFSAQGYETHVVCRYWTGNENSWEDQINGAKDEQVVVSKRNDHCIIHQLPASKNLKRTLSFFAKNKFLNKLFITAISHLGYFHVEVDTYFSFKKYITKNLKDTAFDIVIVTSPPLNIVRLGAHLKKHFPQAFFIADFRDLWDNKLLSAGYQPTKKTAYFNRLYEGYIKKWLKNFNLVTAVSQPLNDEVLRISNSNTEVITNGYEESIFDGIQKSNSNAFVIAAVGTIHPRQEYQILCEGLIAFFKDKEPGSVRLDIIGSKELNTDLCNILTNGIAAENLNITDRLPRAVALQYMKDAAVLIYPGWPAFKGMYSGKIFEYLGSGNNILIAPGDNDVIDDLLKETGAGVSKNTAEEVVQQLEVWYKQWKEKGAADYNGIPEKVRLYSRESQAKKLEQTIVAFKK